MLSTTIHQFCEFSKCILHIYEEKTVFFLIASKYQCQHKINEAKGQETKDLNIVKDDRSPIL
jgi:hypothetical protein